jgi:hypothetical protein
MNPAYIASAGVWAVATGFWFGLGGFGGLGIAGFMVYLGVCVLGGTLCGRFL